MPFETDLLKLLPVAIYMTDAEGFITFYNEAAAEFWGRRPVLNRDRWSGSFRLYALDGSELPHDGGPVALTLKTGQSARQELITERPDGTRVRSVALPQPIKDETGRVTGVINLLMDVTERHQKEAALARIAAIVSSSEDAIIGISLSGQITSWNRSATRIYGYEDSETIGKPINLIIPPELEDQEKRILAQIASGEHIKHYDTVRLAKGGQRVHVSLTVSLLYDDAGKVVGASKTARDITERKRSEELKNLLLGELNHRVKNTLAIIQSIATQTLRRAPSPPDFVSSFSGRVQALARAHTLFTRDSWQGTHIADLVRDQLMLDNNDERISYSGPPVAMDPQVAVNFSMILHELGTNARKYGALSVAGGRLSVKWELLPGSRGGTESILLCWIERGGPIVHEPLRHGFGTMLIEKGLKTYGGEAELQYDPEGLICIIRLPLPKGTLADSTLSLPRNGHSAFLLEHDRISLNGKRILIIEDEPLVWMDIETFLSESGSIIVGPAGNIDSARLLIKAEKFDGVLMDANLGGQPVDELAAALVKRNIPFVFLTGYGRESLPKAFRDSRMVAKPYTREQLLTAAAQMFEPDVVD